MKAVRIHEFGDIDVLRHDEIELPSITDHEVLIKVVATTVNPVDWRIRDGYLKEMVPHQLPLTLGWDVAGIIYQVGSSISHLRIGEPVYALADISRDGAYAEYIAVNAAAVAKKPSTLSFSAAAALPMVGTTAWEAVINRANIQKGQTILIHAGAGGVGSMAIQLAHWRGATVIATASKRHHELLRSLGADEVIDYNEVDFSRVVNNVDAVIDTMGGDIQMASWQTLKPGGILVSLLQAVDESELSARGQRAVFFFVQPSAEILGQLTELVEQGVVRPVIDSEYALTDIAMAQRRSETGHACGKIVVQVAAPWLYNLHHIDNQEKRGLASY